MNWCYFYSLKLYKRLGTWSIKALKNEPLWIPAAGTVQLVFSWASCSI